MSAPPAMSAADGAFVLSAAGVTVRRSSVNQAGR